MKKNNKKGFTLIELLAVLVVLAILALIAIPIVIKVINNVREDSYKRSIEGYARAVEMGLARYAMLYPGEEFPTDIKNIKNKETDESLVDIKGDQVTCKIMEVDKDTCLINLYQCYTEKSYRSNKVLRFKYKNGSVERDIDDEEESHTYEEYKVGDTFTFSGSNYYVISESGINDSSVVALRDYALTSQEFTNLNITPAFAPNGYGYVYFDNTEPKSSEYETSDVKKIIDTWAATLPVGVKEARLIKLEELTNNLGYEYYVEGTQSGYRKTVTTPSWVYGSSCWTMSASQDSQSYVWSVMDYGDLSSKDICDVYSTSVIRPVINVLKSAITKN